MKVKFSCRKDFLKVNDSGAMVDVEADFVDSNSLEMTDYKPHLPVKDILANASRGEVLEAMKELFDPSDFIDYDVDISLNWDYR